MAQTEYIEREHTTHGTGTNYMKATVKKSVRYIFMESVQDVMS